MLVIRLQRTGRTNAPAYRVVVAEKRNPVKGGYLELLGHYLPTRDPAVFEFDRDRVAHWVRNGARPSDTVARLFKRSGMEGMDTFIEAYTKRRNKKAPPEEPAPKPAPAAAESAPVQDAAPAEETPAAVEAPAEDTSASVEAPTVEQSAPESNEAAPADAPSPAPETPAEEGGDTEEKAA